MKLKSFKIVGRNKSIRSEIFWAFLLSFLIAVFCFLIVSTCISLLVNFFQLPYVLHNISLVSFVIMFTYAFYKRTHPMVNELINLADGLQTISEGNLDYRVLVKRKDELGRVAANINLMAERLQLQIEKERKIESSKMELITGVSHDLRTPLTSIIGYLDLLRTDSFQDQAEYTRFVQNTYNKAIHLKKLIDDLFEYTRLTSTPIQTDWETVDIHHMLSQMLFEFEPLAQENDIEIVKKLGYTPVYAAIDSGKMARAIDNLLMNALKYSIKPSKLQISLNIGLKQLYIAVENTGHPLTPEQENKIFDRFYKVDHARSSEGIQHGTGLGLNIARNIVEMHGGTLSLKHHDGNFIFTIAIPVIKGTS